MPDAGPTQPDTAHALSTAPRVHKGSLLAQYEMGSRHTGIAYLTGFYALGFTLAFWGGMLWTPRIFWENIDPFKAVISGVAIATSVVVVVVARWELVDEIPLTRLTRVWLPLAILGIVATEGWFDHVFFVPEPQEAWLGISWGCVMLTIFPLVVRGSPMANTVNAAVAATLPAVVLTLFAYAQGAPPSTLMVFGLTIPLLICVVLGMVPCMMASRYDQGMAKARQLGSYRLVSRLGEGGMGEVWLAEHHMLARPAAIKLIRPEALGRAQTAGSTSGSTLARFRREAQATAFLESPHTIKIYDFGMTDDDAFYYVMELLQGLDMQSLIERFGPLPVERAVFLLRQVCESLGEAHDQGLIHRDIKPANIYVCRRGRDHDFVKVLDFGLVKATEASGRDETKLTAEGISAGTPAYMSPEAVMGQSDIDAAGDIYSLGCVAYWLVTGREVFEGDTPMAVAIKHVNETPTPPSRVSERAIPEPFDDLVLRCLAKKPADRPRSMDEVRELIDHCWGGEWDGGVARDWWLAHLPEHARAPVTHDCKAAEGSTKPQS